MAHCLSENGRTVSRNSCISERRVENGLMSTTLRTFSEIVLIAVATCLSACATENPYRCPALASDVERSGDAIVVGEVHTSFPDLSSDVANAPFVTNSWQVTPIRVLRNSIGPIVNPFTVAATYSPRSGEASPFIRGGTISVLVIREAAGGEFELVQGETCTTLANTNSK